MTDLNDLPCYLDDKKKDIKRFKFKCTRCGYEADILSNEQNKALYRYDGELGCYIGDCPHCRVHAFALICNDDE